MSSMEFSNFYTFVSLEQEDEIDPLKVREDEMQVREDEMMHLIKLEIDLVVMFEWYE